MPIVIFISYFKYYGDFLTTINFMIFLFLVKKNKHQ